MRISDWSSDVCSSDLRLGATSATNRKPPSRSAPTKKGAALPRRPFHDQDPERETVLLDTVALHPLALHLAVAADGGGVLAGTLFAGLLVMTAQLHFAIHALKLVRESCRDTVCRSVEVSGGAVTLIKNTHVRVS